MTDLVAEANKLATAGRSSEALSLLEAACGKNDPLALFERAVWHLTGKLGVRDLSAALKFLKMAAAAGNTNADQMAIAMTANGSGGRPDWQGAVAMLRTAAVTDPIATVQLALLEQMALDPLGAPTRLPSTRTLAIEPHVAQVGNFLSPQECAYLMHAADALLAPATVVDPDSGRLVEHPVRTSYAGSIGPLREDLVARAIGARIAAITRTIIDQGEPLMVLRYTPGQQYRLHSDAISGTENQRIRTVLIYLSDDYAGGETAFPDLDLKVRGQPGDALIFDNVGGDGRPHALARHAGLPVTSGTKWLATRWIRARPFDPWNPG